MKILYVVHYFLPRHQAGTEIYTANLAREMVERGNEVMVLTSEDPAPGVPEYGVTRDEWEGVPVYRVHRGEPPDFERSYLDPAVDELFGGFLDEHRPDVVHFQHMFRLSTGMALECERRKIPLLITLADYWFICPPILLLQPGGALCPGPDPERCARCGNSIGVLYSGRAGSSLMSSGNPLVAGLGTALHTAADSAVRAAHRAKRALPAPLVERLRASRRSREKADPESSFSRRRSMIEARRRAMKQALGAAAMVIAPSDFLRTKMIEAGAVEADKIVHGDYGFDPAEFLERERDPGLARRFGFIGTPVEHKGVHVAVEAMNLLADTDAELFVHGELSWFPAYARRLEKLRRNPRVHFKGGMPHGSVARALSELDVLIVPSLWYENSPLTIHEAFLAGVIVVTSDMGGMDELVSSGGGKVFRAGDAADLARVSRRLMEDRDETSRLRRSIPPVKTLNENAEELIDYYLSLL